MTSCIGIILGIAIGYGLNFAVIAICYGAIAWAFGLTFSWPITAALALVLCFVTLTLKNIVGRR